MAISHDVARARFAQFIKRALRDARARGMTDLDIKAATGIGPSTFHRWQRGEGAQLPTIEKVRAFCAGLDVPLDAALAALGVENGRPTEPEPAADPDLRRLGRILADPNVPEAEKQAIRHTIRMLSRASRTEPEPAT